MQIFTIYNNQIEGRLDPYFYLPELRGIVQRIKNSKYKTVRFRELIEDMAGGATPKIGQNFYTKSNNGIPFLRVQNITEEGLELNDVKYITSDVHNKLLKRSQLKANELVLTITGRVGNATIIPPNFIGNINQHSVRIKPKDLINPAYLAAYFNTDFGKKLTTKYTTGGTRPALDYQAIYNFPVVLPTQKIQNKVASLLQSAYQQKRYKEKEAQELLDSVDNFVQQKVGFQKQEEQYNMCFIVKKDDLGGILSPHFFISKPTKQKGLLNIFEVAEINPYRKKPSVNSDQNVPYVGLPETDNRAVNNVLLRPYKEVKGRNIIQKGDILFARIEPSIFNKKYIFVNDLKGQDYAFTSTEFYILKGKPEKINQKYLFYILFIDLTFSQIKGKTTGSTGRRRLNKQALAKVKIPVPSLETQTEIVKEIDSRISKAEKLQQEAIENLEKTKKQVEDLILSNN